MIFPPILFFPLVQRQILQGILLSDRFILSFFLSFQICTLHRYDISFKFQLQIIDTIIDRDYTGVKLAISEQSQIKQQNFSHFPIPEEINQAFHSQAISFAKNTIN